MQKLGQNLPLPNGKSSLGNLLKALNPARTRIMENIKKLSNDLVEGWTT
jgi:hypothetical protein